MLAFQVLNLQSLGLNQRVDEYSLPIFLISCLICSTFVPNVYAATITAQSCSQANVQAALNSASRGDTVTIPAGDCTWSGTVSFTKALTIQGAGKSSTIHQKQYWCANWYYVP